MNVLAPLFGLSAKLILASLPALAQICPSGIPRVAPDSRYTDHSNGTVTDQDTGLMWKRCSEGQTGSSCAGNVTSMSWQTALQTAAASSFAGYSDWRLPNANELQSLVETGCHSPAINTTWFPNTPISAYWSSTSSLLRLSESWVVDSDKGEVAATGKSFSYSVRLVRAGQ